LKRATKIAIAPSHFEKSECVKMCDKRGNLWMCKSPNKQGWEIYNFENVPSLFVNSKKVRFINLHFFATFLQICSFQKSDCAIALLVACTKKCDCTFAL